MKALAFVLWLALLFCLSMLLIDVAGAQTFAPGGAVYPSPSPRTFLDQPIAQCVIARPCPWGDCVILSACPPGTLVAPAPLPAPAPPVAEPKTAVEREPIVIQVQPCPVCEVKPAPKAAPKAAPKKPCPC